MPATAQSPAAMFPPGRPVGTTPGDGGFRGGKVAGASSQPGPVTSTPIEVKRAGTSLSEAVGRLAQYRFGTEPPHDALTLVVGLAVDVTPGATAATLRLPEAVADRPPQLFGSHVRFVVLEERRGPSAEVTPEHGPLHARGDLSRWPEFAEVAARLAISDVIASPLAVGDGRRASLSVYAPSSPFSPEAVTAIEVLSRHAAATIDNAIAFERLRLVTDQLHEGLRSREVIGLAKGILMRQERCSEADAFRILVSGSQRLNRKVRDVAQHVVALTEGRSDLSQDPRD